MTQFLMPFLAHKPEFEYAPFDYPLTAFERAASVVSPIESYPRVGIPLVLAANYNELFEELGFWEIPLKPVKGDTAQKISETETLGWAAMVISKGHVALEVGDADHHVRFDMKETWIGHRLAYQIDQVTLWDKDRIYHVPCAEGSDRTPLESLMRTVDLTVPALQNGDDGEGVKAFSEVADIKRQFPICVTNKTWVRPKRYKIV